MTNSGLAAKRVVVIGGGLIGLLSAYELERKGATVTVVEKGELGDGASPGNTGWVVPVLSGPVPAPGLTKLTLKWMLKRNSPFYIHPAALPRLAPWLWKFWRHCNQRDYVAGLHATAELNRHTMTLFDALRANGIDFEMHASGILFVSTDRSYIEHMADDIRLLEPYGYQRPVILSGNEVRQLEPALSMAVQSGILVEQDRYLRPESLMAGITRRLNETGVDIRTHAAVTAVHRSGTKITDVTTSDGHIQADAFVIAAGAWSGQLAGMFGFQLPMQGGTGYSTSIAHPIVNLRYPLYLADAKVACSPFDGQLRLAGTMELSGLQPSLNQRRIAAIRSSAARYFLDWQTSGPNDEWVGMRPMTPDGLPVIGRAPNLDNVCVATGHAMLGVTMAPVTALAVAELLCAGATRLPIEPFSPARFN